MVNKSDFDCSVERVSICLEESRYSEISGILQALHPAEIARLIECFPQDTRHKLWDMVDPEIRPQVMIELGEDVFLSLASELESKEFTEAISHMDADEIADVIAELPDDIAEEIKSNLSEDILEKLETNLSFGEGTAGRLMSSDAITVRSDISIETVRRFLHRKKKLPTNTDCLMVVDRSGKYMGKLSLQDLLTADEEDRVESVMQKDERAILATMEENEIARYFENRDLLSVAVIDDTQTLLGRITVDDVLDILRDQANHALMSSAGLDDEADLFAPVKKSVQDRSLWLGINLITALLASWVIGLFEATIDKIVALAVLMPIVASMGGIAGSQTLALIMRGIALNQVSRSNIYRLFKKEIFIGALNGIIWAIGIAIIASIWFHSAGIGLVIGIAIIINLVAAALSGFVIPVVLNKMGIDPAISGPVVLTTVTDVTGFFAFLGLATVFLLQ